MRIVLYKIYMHLISDVINLNRIVIIIISVFQKCFNSCYHNMVRFMFAYEFTFISPFIIRSAYALVF